MPSQSLLAGSRHDPAGDLQIRPGWRSESGRAMGKQPPLLRCALILLAIAVEDAEDGLCGCRFSDALRRVPFSCGNRVRAPYSGLQGLEPDYQTLRRYRGVIASVRR